MPYKFYYDETEHSRKITQATVENEYYYENFISVIVGWNKDDEAEIEKKYLAFEDKYEERKKNGELKSLILKQKQFKNGFASMSRENLDLISDFLDIFDSRIYVYFSVQSKIEYVISQLLSNYRNSVLIDENALAYILVKAIHVYKPQRVIDSIYNRPEDLLYEIRKFLVERIELNNGNIELKKRENQAFGEALLVLKDMAPIKSLNWDYHMPFDGFEKFLAEQRIDDYFLIIDREGCEHKTLRAAKDFGHNNSLEMDSSECFGIRMADILAGIIAKFMKAFSYGMASDYKELKKVLLDNKWFKLDEHKQSIYRKLRYVICEINDSWYKSYASTYADDLLGIIALLEYIDKVPVEDMEASIEKQGEFFNQFLCGSLQQYYDRIRTEKISMMGLNSFSQYENIGNWGEKSAPIIAVSKIYPNEKCPCGSGRKYKKCCGNIK